MTRKIDIEALCADKGLRITEQRKTIARVLGDSEDHPDVETLHARASAIDPNISIATVYRTVRLFEEAGNPRAARVRRRPFALRSGVRNPPRPSDRRRDWQCHRVRRRRAGGAAETDCGEARLPARRPSHGALRRLPRPRPLSRSPPRESSRGSPHCRADPAVPVLRARCTCDQAAAPPLAMAAVVPRRVRVDHRSARATDWRAHPPPHFARVQSHQLARHPDPWRRDEVRVRLEGRARTSAWCTGSPTRTRPFM